MKRLPPFKAQRSTPNIQRGPVRLAPGLVALLGTTFDVRWSTFNSQRPRLSAFTLIEVLIALTVFAMASTYLMSTFVNTLTVRERSVSDDVLHADIRAVRMQLLLEPNLEDAEDGGDYPTLNHGVARWQALIEPTEVVDLFQVELTIQFSEAPEGRPDRYMETLFLLRSTWSEADERSDLLEEKREALERTRNFDRF